MNAILLLLLFLILGGCSVFGITESTISQPPAPDVEVITVVPDENNEPMMQIRTVIESADVLVHESDPAVVVVSVIGYQPDGCEYPVTVVQRREGSGIFVDIYREMPLAVACPASIVPYTDTITLDGPFEPGTYTVHVNDMVMEVTM